KKKINYVALEREKFMKSGKASIGKRKKKSEADILERLRGFQEKLHTVVAEDTVILPLQPDDTELCSLHSVPNCLSCRDTFGQSKATDTDEGWLSHKLVFEKDYKGKDLMQRRDDPNDYVVIDPLERKKQAIEEQREKRAQRNDIGEAFQRIETIPYLPALTITKRNDVEFVRTSYPSHDLTDFPCHAHLAYPKIPPTVIVYKQETCLQAASDG
ncbi:5889_t:CDS:2, partial [Paraglomus occultum]